MKAMFTFSLLATVWAALAASGWQRHVYAAPPNSPQPGSGVRIGTFDSRALAIAYYRSAPFQKILAEKRAQLSKAKAAGDSAAAGQLEAEGRRLQDQINRQGFGNAPIGDVIKHVENELPKVSDKAGVDVIVSRWEVVFEKSGTTFVDVTDQLVQLYKPDKKTLKVIAAVRKTKPVPSDELHTDP